MDPLQQQSSIMPPPLPSQLQYPSKRPFEALPGSAHFHKHARSTSSQTMGPLPLDTPVSLSPEPGALDELDEGEEHGALPPLPNGSPSALPFRYLHPGQADAGRLLRERTHGSITLKEWHILQKYTSQASAMENSRSVHADHTNPLTIASVVAVAKHKVTVDIEDPVSAIRQVTQSVDHLAARLNDGHSLYGITTGFGGSANTRTTRPLELQRALLQHQQSGVLPVTKKPNSIHASLRVTPNMSFMPEEWVRGAMVVRCKSLLNGHSALRYDVIELLMALINENLIPLVPLRGSISASGDLQPLSYIAGALEGNPDIWIWTDDQHGGRDLIPAHVALQQIKRTPIIFGPKEGLAVLNGTAFSCAVASLALQDANHLAVLSQVMTAIGVEALAGTTASFDSFFALVRPHRGQAEAANNIRRFLVGSGLAKHEGDETEAADQDSLRQDRYALRTASQWIGPQLEDLTLAHEQLTVECNSTTDNPLIDVTEDIVHHGGNFQAATVTSAMEKTRLSLQMFGRMIFAQCTELINPALNNGLPPNLAIDEPSTSYTFKGVDINIAAYQSELAYLANPVSSHVQTAEMGNQAINSLALVSARYTHQALDVLFTMSAAYLYALCQALDLRAFHILFMQQAEEEVRALTSETFEYVVPDQNQRQQLVNTILCQLTKQIDATTHMDSGHRFSTIADTLQGAILSTLLALRSSKSSMPKNTAMSEPQATSHGPSMVNLSGDTFEESITSQPPAPPVDPQTASSILELLQEWRIRCASRLCDIFRTTRSTYIAKPDALPYLGRASRAMYLFIRNELSVPLHAGLADCPSAENHKKTVGGNISIIYEALRDGRLTGIYLGLLS